MKQLRIEGKRPLKGTIRISGAKNSAVALIPASLLSDDVVTIDNIPHISDIEALNEILNYLGAKVEMEENLIRIDSSTIVNKEIPESISKKYTVAQLKELLKENGLKVSGKKQELVERLLPVLGESSGDYELTDKAKKFIEENQWIDLYMFALVAFRFDDYETYVKASSEDDVPTALKFCDEIISRALMSNQFLVFIDALIPPIAITDCARSE